MIDVAEGTDGYVYVSSITGIFRLVLSTTSSSLSFGPDADSSVFEGTPDTNLGSDTALEIDSTDGGFERQAYLRFTVTGVTEPVLSAEVRLFVTNASPSGGIMTTVSDDSWGESSITWNNKPAIDGAVLSSAGEVVSGEIVSFDVSSAVTGDGTLSVAITTLSTNGVDYSSKEASSNRPVLEVVHSGEPPPLPNPPQVHLSTSTGDPSTEVTATWKTGTSTSQSLRFGTTTGVYTQTPAATEYTYPDVSAGGDVCCMQAVQATGLAPNTVYYYQVGSDTDGWSDEYSFRTAPAKGDTSPFSFVAFGDQGVDHTGSTRRPRDVAASVAQDDPDLILHAGDVTYCDDQSCVDTYFDDVMGANFSGAYYMAAPGNHEFSQPDDLITYTSRLSYPGRLPHELCTLAGTSCEPGEVPELWYSFDWGNVHLVSINTGESHDEPFTGAGQMQPGEARYDWLESDLAAASADPLIDWIVVYGHFALYNWADGPSHASDDEARTALEPLVEQYGVDLWIGGHQHAYERTLPVANDGLDVDIASCGPAPYSECNAPQHTIYFTAGTGGRQLYSDSTTSCGDAANCDLWSAVRINGSFGHLRVSVNDRDLTAEFVDIDRNVLDSVTISLANNPPVADPGGPYSGTEDAPLVFDGSASSDVDGDTLTYAWDFGDGDTGTGVGPTHAYTAGGTYTVTLTVHDGMVSSTPATTTATIAEVNDVPVADPGGPYAGTEDVPLALDGSASSDPDGDTLTYAWEFGDGGTDTGVSPSHAYTAGGTYTVTLTVHDGMVSSTPATSTATIAEVNDVPGADPGGPYSGTEDAPLAFDGSASSDPDGDTLTYAWDFGDGGTDTGVGPSHAYTAGDIYTVTLTVHDGIASSTAATTTATIADVNDVPVADPGGPYSGTEDVPLAFNGSASSDLDGDTLTYAWDFGDGGDGTGVNPSNTYTAGGSYTVTLTVHDGIVSSTPATTTASITEVNDVPVADPGGPYPGTEDVPLAFDGSGSSDFDGDTLTYAWNFGDGSTGTGVSPSNTYAAGGTFTVTLTVHDGIVSSTLATTTATIVDVNDVPVAGPGGPYTGTEDLPVAFDGDTLTYAWDFGDGSGTATGVGPTHAYAVGGAFTVTLTVHDGVATSTPATTTATIAALPDAPSALQATTTSPSQITLTWNDNSDDEGDFHVERSPDGSIWSQIATVGANSTSYQDASLPCSTMHHYRVRAHRHGDDAYSAYSNTGSSATASCPPVVAAGADQTVDEGALVSLAPATFTDLDAGDTHTASIDWGDGSGPGVGAVDQEARVVSGSHVYADDGTYTVVVTVTDDAGISGSDSMAVTVNNAAPSVEVGPDHVVDEGEPVSLAPTTFTDYGTADTHSATITWGDGTAAEPGTVTESPFGPPGSTAGANGTVSSSHVYDDDGSYTVTVTVTDDDGASMPGGLTVTVHNVPPLVEAGPDQTVELGIPINVDASFTDAGSADSHTASIAWGDGSETAGAVTEASGAGTVSATHSYASLDSFVVTVTVFDDDAGTSTDTFTVTVEPAAPTATPIPAVPGWGLVAMSALLAALMLWRLRGRVRGEGYSAEQPN